MQDAISYLGIDPGKMGAMALLSHETRTSAPAVTSVFTFKDKTEADIWNHLSELLQAHEIHKAVLENVSSSPQMGVTSAFTFGKGYGFLLGMLAASGLSYELVTPQVWERKLGCLSKGNKKITRAKAQQLYNGQTKVTHGNADALLIATYCSRKERGLL